MTVDELAQATGYSRQWVYKMVGSGMIAATTTRAAFPTPHGVRTITRTEVLVTHEQAAHMARRRAKGMRR